MAGPNPKRRWYQFSLLTLLIVVLVSCVVFAWMGVRMQRAKENRERVEIEKALVEKTVPRLEELGGTFFIVYERRFPSWLQKQFNDPGDLIGDFTVSAQGNGQFNDAGLDHLKALSNLSQLDLRGTKVTDAGMAHLEGHSNLEMLLLDNTNVSDLGMMHLARLKGLETLSLFNTKVTDAGYSHLKGLTNLRTIGAHTNLTDKGLAHLSGLTNLDHLAINGTKISDAGLRHLSGLTNLTKLALGNTKVTDAGLIHLNGLKNLEWLGLTGTKVTDAGVKNLQRALPQCKIHK